MVRNVCIKDLLYTEIFCIILIITKLRLCVDNSNKFRHENKNLSGFKQIK